jgi:hypothetical protein
MLQHQERMYQLHTTYKKKFLNHIHIHNHILHRKSHRDLMILYQLDMVDMVLLGLKRSSVDMVHRHSQVGMYLVSILNMSMNLLLRSNLVDRVDKLLLQWSNFLQDKEYKQ